MRCWLPSTRFRRRINVTMMVIPPAETLLDRGLLPPTCQLRTHTPSRNVPFRMRDKLWSVVWSKGKGKVIYCGVLQHLALQLIDERRYKTAHCSIDPRWICVLGHTTAALLWRKGSWYSLNRMGGVTHGLGRRFGEDKHFVSLQGSDFDPLVVHPVDLLPYRRIFWCFADRASQYIYLSN